MISFEEKQKIINDFQLKYPNEILHSWNESHEYIPKIINEKKYKIGVEIGCAYGHHLENILSKTNVEQLYGIDPYTPYKQYEGDSMCKSTESMEDLYSFVKSNLSYYKDRFKLIRDFSNKAVKLFENESLDFVYIDGNHFEEFIKQDITDWWPKVKTRGIISGHDYDHSYFTHVTTTVDSFFKNINKEVNYLGNHVWCVYK